jgi:sensor histidine kinase YesM
MWLSRRFLVRRALWWKHLVVLGVAGAGFVAAKMALQIPLVRLAHASMGDGPVTWNFYRSVVFANFHMQYLLYAMIVLAAHLLVYQRESRERELKATALEAQLAQAQLQVLKMQLHPHFLFNTLHAISALLHRDAEAADRMLARLSDLLRQALDRGDRPFVALREELEFLNGYLEIEQTRFADRLKVEFDVDPEALEEPVPSMLLQPLVENAVRHGVAARSTPGTILVRARPGGGRLRIAVCDDGPGMSNSPGSGQGNGGAAGVGLANTRARLQTLYNGAHRFEMRNGKDGGLTVEIDIPCAPVRGVERA